MKYLPIFQELFESRDLVVIPLIGLAVSVIVGLFLKRAKKIGIAMMCSAVIFAAYGPLATLHTNYAMQFVVWFLGTFAIGAFIGFGISLLLRLIRQK